VRVSDATPPTEPARPLALAWATYTALRFAVFCLTAAVLFLGFRANGLVLLLVALLISSILSLFLLSSQRDALVRAQQARLARRREEAVRARDRLEASQDLGSEA
jgi:hypothetical protein